MENNKQEFSMDEYNDFLKKIKSGSPVHKINFNIENPNAIVGMYLMTLPNVKSYIDKVKDTEDLTNDTLLSFENRHVIECCQIIYGSLYALEGINAIQVSKLWVINRILSSLLLRPMFYKDVVVELGNISRDTVKSGNSEEIKIVYNNLKYVIENIWFIPYGTIDEIAKEAIQEFEKRYGDNSSNE